MDIEAWFETMPSEVVNDIAQEKRYIWFAIHDAKALSFKNQLHLIKEINLMSRKVKDARANVPQITDTAKKSSSGNGASNRARTRWANIDIRSREHKDRIRELSSKVDYILDAIVELVDDGYDLHVKRADEGSTVTAMLFCGSGVQCSQNAGLSASAPDAWLSLSSLVYKHSVVCEGRWFTEPESEEDDNWR